MARVDKGWFENIGSRASAWVSDIAALPYAQLGVIAFCAVWWTVGLPTDILTAALSIMAITLTQMVLNRQGERELDVHRRDLAMHAKLDELVIATRRASNRVVGIENDLDAEEIEEIREELRDVVTKLDDEDPDARERTPPVGAPIPLAEAGST